jgi:hypothetical protein
VAVKKVFKSYIPSNNYITQKGDVCQFINGVFTTDDPRVIAELEWEINKSRNPHFYIDPNEKEIDTTLQDRLRAAQAKAVAEELERYNRELAAAAGKSVDEIQQEQAKTDAQKATATSESVAATPGVVIPGVQPQVGNQQVGMSAATLLNITNSAAIASAAKGK